MVGGPAHGPQVDVVQLAARVWMTLAVLVTLSVHEELTLTITHHSRPWNGAVVSHGNQSQPPQNGGDGCR